MDDRGSMARDEDALTTFKVGRRSFIRLGLQSAGMGGLLSWIVYLTTESEWLPWAILAYFGMTTLKVFVQGFVVPQWLTLYFSRESIVGPCLWWWYRDEIYWKDVDWDLSGVQIERLVIQSKDRRIVSRLAWYEPDDRSEILRLWTAQEREFRS